MTYHDPYWTISRAALISFLFLITWCGRAAAQAVPTLVQHVHGSNTLAIQSPSWIGGANNRYTIYLPNPSQGGNCIVVGMRFDNTHNPAIAVTDDKGNVYNLGNVS